MVRLLIDIWILFGSLGVLFGILYPLPHVCCVGSFAETARSSETEIDEGSEDANRPGRHKHLWFGYPLS